MSSSRARSFEDVAGGNDLHRVDIALRDRPPAEVADVTVTHDVHRSPPTRAAVCFADSDQTTGRFSYLSDRRGTEVDHVDLPERLHHRDLREDGHRLGRDRQRLAKAIVHSGNRETMPGMPWSQWDWTASPTALGISNLREFQ